MEQPESSIEECVELTGIYRGATCPTTSLGISCPLMTFYALKHRHEGTQKQKADISKRNAIVMVL